MIKNMEFVLKHKNKLVHFFQGLLLLTQKKYNKKLYNNPRRSSAANLIQEQTEAVSDRWSFLHAEATLPIHPLNAWNYVENDPLFNVK